MLRLLSLFLTGGLLLALAACGQLPTGAEQSLAATDTLGGGDAVTPEASEEQPAGTETGPAAIVGQFTRSGGFAGLTQTLVIKSDGTLQLLDGGADGQPLKTARTSRAQVESLEAAFASSEWQNLADEHGKQVPDGFAYTITGGEKQVVTYDAAQNPAILDTVLQQLNNLWQTAMAAA